MKIIHQNIKFDEFIIDGKSLEEQDENSGN